MGLVFAANLVSPLSRPPKMNTSKCVVAGCRGAKNTIRLQSGGSGKCHQNYMCLHFALRVCVFLDSRGDWFLIAMSAGFNVCDRQQSTSWTLAARPARSLGCPKPFFFPQPCRVVLFNCKQVDLQLYQEALTRRTVRSKELKGHPLINKLPWCMAPPLSRRIVASCAPFFM